MHNVEIVKVDFLAYCFLPLFDELQLNKLLKFLNETFTFRMKRGFWNKTMWAYIKLERTIKENIVFAKSGAVFRIF